MPIRVNFAVVCASTLSWFLYLQMLQLEQVVPQCLYNPAVNGCKGDWIDGIMIVKERVKYVSLQDTIWKRI